MSDIDIIEWLDGQRELYIEQREQVILSQDVNEAQDGINALTEAIELMQKEDGWISVDDRLPSDGQEVYTFGTFGYGIDCWSEQHERPLSFSSATIVTSMAWDNNDYEDVTHWMALPIPPKHIENQDD